MSFPNNHTYKVANGISTISRIDRRAANRKTYASEAGVPYTTDDQVEILEVVKKVDTERLREAIPHLMGLTWDDELWVRSMIAEKVIFQMRGRFGELEHPIKKELWYTLQRGIYDQDLLEHGATVPRAVRHATASTTLLWSLVLEGESRVERLEREVKEAKADVLRLSAEGLLMKETLAAFQQGTNEALEAMVANHQELVAGLKVRDNNIKGALNRRDTKMEELEDIVSVLSAQVESLQDKTCNCKEGPVLVGQGTADVPFELEYTDEVVLPSPNPSSYATPLIENAVPVPTPAPASTLAESDKENCRRCPLQPISQLVKIEDEVMEVDRAEDVPRAIELSRMVTRRDDPSNTGSTVPTDRSSRRSNSDTSFDSHDRIPPRGPTRETVGLSLTTSTALPSSHPVMEMWDQVFSSSVTSGRLIGPLEGISSYRLELEVQLSVEDGDAMFGEILAPTVSDEDPVPDASPVPSCTGESPSPGQTTTATTPTPEVIPSPVTENRMSPSTTSPSPALPPLTAPQTSMPTPPPVTPGSMLSAPHSIASIASPSPTPRVRPFKHDPSYPAFITPAVIDYLNSVDGGPDWAEMVGGYLVLESEYPLRRVGRLALQNCPEEVIHWAREHDSTPSITNVQQFHGKWVAWWRIYQPKWRMTETWPFTQGDAKGKDWARPNVTGLSGLFPVVISMCWWAASMTSDSERRAFDVAVKDLRWVIENLIYFNSQLQVAGPESTATLADHFPGHSQREAGKRKVKPTPKANATT
ncbi:hypothetical protein BJ322DRAFT_1108719 [Thelephora terrestris]|uniref:Uncharacterized protein n=1 Tax=Thelephora terrestris TaxID=56493 RepID=A0A9P6HER9_9AGAM|nr:hypothetical protein BJ322DRAFT_1108719 [Thelephora terrestris]